MPIKTKCCICEKDVWKYLSQLKRAKKNYCSRKCKDSDHKEKIPKKCLCCGKEFEVYPSEERINYCSKKCHSKDKRKPIKYKMDLNGCWNCISHFKDEDGYPYVKREGVSWRMNRWVYVKKKGKIPENMVVRHTCDNPSCINPKHLILGTTQDNTQDMILRDRQIRGKGCHSSVLTSKEVLAIRKSHKEGISQSELAKKYGIGTSSMFKVIHRISWKHI